MPPSKRAVKHIVGIGFSTCGLLLGFLCIGKGVETAFSKDVNHLDQPTATVGLLLGLPTTVGALWILKDLKRDLQLTQSQQLQALFYKALRANNGQISAIQFAMLGQVSFADAQTCLEAWARLMNADLQVDDAGVVMYCFPLSQ